MKLQLIDLAVENRRSLAALSADYADLKQQLQDQSDEKPIYRDAEYAMQFIGISESTLARHQRRGDLVVAKVEKGKRYFTHQDLERFKKDYWNL